MLMVLLLSWIVANSAYQFPQGSDLPPVIEKSQTELKQILFCTGERNCSADKTPSGVRIAALYDHHANVLYVMNGFSVEEEEDVSTLVHEMVHYVQRLAGKLDGVTCFGHLEREAYGIEDKWRIEHGLPKLPVIWGRMLFEVCSEHT